MKKVICSMLVILFVVTGCRLPTEGVEHTREVEVLVKNIKQSITSSESLELNLVWKEKEKETRRLSHYKDSKGNLEIEKDNAFLYIVDRTSYRYVTKGDAVYKLKKETKKSTDTIDQDSRKEYIDFLTKYVDRCNLEHQEMTSKQGIYKSTFDSCSLDGLDIVGTFEIDEKTYESTLTFDIKNQDRTMVFTYNDQPMNKVRLPKVPVKKAE